MGILDKLVGLLSMISFSFLTFDNKLKRAFLADGSDSHFALIAARVRIGHFFKMGFPIELNVVLINK